jgi:DNA integrity scanning protein DisA with diadenylate cyclase activity
MSNEGKGGLITIGDSDNVLKMTNLAKENFLTWKQLKILESPDEALMGLFSQDGATIISNEGLIVNSMVQLQPDPKIVCEEEVGKGMKHITAGKVSAATSTISIAISVDGRITVFADDKIRFKMMG